MVDRAIPIIYINGAGTGRKRPIESRRASSQAWIATKLNNMGLKFIMCDFLG